MLLTMPQRGADSSTFPGVTNKAFRSTLPNWCTSQSLKSATTLLRSAPIDSRMASFSRTAGANLENRGCGVQDYNQSPAELLETISLAGSSYPRFNMSIEWTLK
jgi:hypothetical protein